MVFARQPLVRLANLLRIGAPAYAESFVIIVLCARRGHVSHQTAGGHRLHTLFVKFNGRRLFLTSYLLADLLTYLLTYLLLISHIDELGIHHVVFGMLARLGTCLSARLRSCARPVRTRTLRLVHRLGQLVARRGQLICRRVDLIEVAVGNRLLDVLDRGFHLLRIRFGDLVAMFLQHLLDVVNHRVRPIPSFNLILLLPVVGRVRFGVARHLLYLVLAQARRRCDRDLLFVIRGAILRGHVQDSVRVNVERYLNLRNAARRGRNSNQLEHPEQPVVPSHGAFALSDLDLYRRLAVRRRREDFALARRYGRVALNQLRKYAAQRFDSERQRCHIEQQHILHFAAEHAALYGRTHCDDFVWIHALVGLLAEQIAHNLLYLRNTRRTADQHHFINVLRCHAGVLHGLFARPNRTLQNIVHHLLKAC